MGKLGNISGKEAAKAFQKAGWTPIGQVGSHLVLVKSGDSQSIDSDHTLLGILREGEETVSKIFRRFKVDPEKVQRAIEGDHFVGKNISYSATAELQLGGLEL